MTGRIVPQVRVAVSRMTAITKPKMMRQPTISSAVAKLPRTEMMIGKLPQIR